MNRISAGEMEQIKKELEVEFPGDMALQQIHFARKILAKEAEAKKQSYLGYVKSLRQVETSAPEPSTKSNSIG